jgi:hypothetical protein
MKSDELVNYSHSDEGPGSDYESAEEECTNGENGELCIQLTTLKRINDGEDFHSILEYLQKELLKIWTDKDLNFLETIELAELNHEERTLYLKSLGNICQKENKSQSFKNVLLQNIITDGLQKKLVFQYFKKNQTNADYEDILNLFHNGQVDVNWLIDNIEN